MGIIRKLYDKGEDTINNLKKKYQNPLREFEKEINLLKAYLKESKSLSAHINALRIRAEKDILSHEEQVLKYQKKAEEAILNESSGESVSETISVNALKIKKSYENRIEELKNKIPNYDEELVLMKEKISDLDTKIDYYENEYNFLLKRTTTSQKQEKVNFYSDSPIINRLEKLKEAILKQNTKSDIYTEKSDKMYENIKSDEIYDEYKELKAKLKK